MYLDTLNHLCARQDLNFLQIEALFKAIVEDRLNEIELSALLIALKCKGESPLEIANAAKTLLVECSLQGNWVDNCGTGGDGIKSINISTISALVCASLGVKMAKAGNYSASGSGSADLLQDLGLNLSMPQERLTISLNQTNFAFLFAPLYYPSFAKVAKLRRVLQTRTIFNLLGPLLNPLRPTIQLLGVYDAKLCYPLALALQELGVKRAMVVHGSATDEVALHGKTFVCELKEREITQYDLYPSDFGLKSYPLDAIKSTGLKQNVQICLDILQGKGTEAHKASIAANSACVLYLTGRVSDLKEGAKMAQECMQSQKAYENLERIVKISHA
ncbi:anthranilate phosphoribosyltransferase [Helicobacter suis]|uniref:anthranilate phosphoribosyltransferase n=1 Tax=Helicobacter suis TaxID=104628 RepID=UPI0013D39A20|nr:anthranilate phosphoribosyltransferase [Helicobacter suis]